MADDVIGDLKQILVGTSIVLVGNAVGMGAAFGTRFLAGRHLGPSGYGLVVLGITSVNVVALVGLLGLHRGLARQLPRTDEQSAMFQATVILVFGPSLLIATLLFTFAESMARVFATPAFVPILRLFSVVFPLIVVMRLVVGGLRGLKDAPGRVLVFNFVYQGVTLIGVAVGVAMRVDAVGIAAAWVVSIVLAVIVGVARLRTHIPIFDVRSMELPFRSINTRGLVWLSLPLMASGASWALMQQADVIIIGFFSLPSSVGLYDASFTLARGLIIFTWSFSFLYVPVASGLLADGRKADVSRIYQLVTKWMVFFALPLYFVVLIYPGLILSLVFGDSFRAGGLVLVMISTGFFVEILSGQNRSTLVASGRTPAVLRGNIVTLGLNLLANILLVPILGIVGAAVASLMSYSVANTYYLYLVHEDLGALPLDRSMIRTGITSTIVLIPGLWMVGDIISVGFYRLAGLSMITVILHLLIVLHTDGIDQEDRKLFKDLRDALGKH
jgi:O-antigen/teichoic acid export membrane protein